MNIDFNCMAEHEKKICRNCKVVRRNGVVRVSCNTDPRHKQRQG